MGEHPSALSGSTVNQIGISERNGIGQAGFL
jgi:hypothetical protein